MKPLDVGVELCPLVGSCSYYKSVSWDQVLFIEILIYIFIKKTVWWWGKIWFILSLQLLL